MDRWLQALGIVWLMWATIGLGYVGLSYALLWERTKKKIAAGGKPPESIFKSDSWWVVVVLVGVSILVGVVAGPLSLWIWRLDMSPDD